jgi:hypothetical protein
MDSFDFSDLKPTEIPVVSPDGGKYVLREASVGAATCYENAQARAIKFDDGKMIGLDGIYDADLVLLSQCLHKCDNAGTPKMDTSGNPYPTDVAIIKKWPPKMYKALVTKLKEISPDLERADTEEVLVKQIENITKRLETLRKSKGEDPAKNSQGATASISA